MPRNLSYHPKNSAYLTEEMCMETHPGFKIICQKCQGIKVYFENDMGFSPESGAWGSANLVCNNCDNSTVLAE